MKQKMRLHHIGLGGYFWVDQQDHFSKGFLSFHHLFRLEIQTSLVEEQVEPEDEERLPQGSQETPTLVITANKVQDLEVLGPAAVSYISKEQGLQMDQRQDQGQQEQGVAAAVLGLEEKGEQQAQEGQGLVRVGVQGGGNRGQSWYDMTEQEVTQEETHMRVTAAKAAAKEAAKAAAMAAAAAAAQATAKPTVDLGQEEPVGQAGSSQDHLVQQEQEGPLGQQGQEEVEEARVSKAKEVQAGILAKLSKWLGGCQ